MSIENQIERINQNISNTYTELEALGADAPDNKNSDNLAATVQSVKAILYTNQDLTEDQKEQARKNIGLDSGQNLNFRDVLPGEIFVLDTAGGGNDTPDPGGDSGGDTGGNPEIDIPADGLLAYYDMRTPLTADNLITDLSGNGKHILFNPANGYYQDGKMYRGDKYTSGWGAIDTRNITGGAHGIAYGNAVTVLATISGTFGSGTTPVCMLGDSEAYTNLTAFKGNLMVYQTAGWNKPENKTPLTANTIQTVAFSAVSGGNEVVYIGGVAKNTNTATNLNLGESLYLLTGYGSGGDTSQAIHNIAVYNRELSADEIAAISATLLANAGGATA